MPTTLSMRAAAPRRGFTLTELLVVIAVIAILIGIIVPSIGKIRSMARTTKCLTNQRSITQANYAYATDSNGRWASPRTDTSGTTANGQAMASPWVLATGTNVAGTFEKVSALEQGALFPYIGSVQIYLSPEEPTNTGTTLTSDTSTRVRSYSINSCLGVTRPDEWPNVDVNFTNPNQGEAGAQTVPLSDFNTTTIARVKQPARMLSTIVEKDEGYAYNFNGWLVLPQRSNPMWIDLPAPWRPDAITLTYADGSTGTHAMANTDICAVNAGAPYPAGITVAGPGPHNVTVAPEVNLNPDDTSDAIPFCKDWKWFRDRMNPGVIPAIPGLPAWSE